MKLILRAEIPGLPPSVNGMYRTPPKGKRVRYKIPKVKDWQKKATPLLLRGRARGIDWPFTGPVVLAITLRRNNHIRWDLDNRVKALQDCLNAKGGIGVVKDDCQADKLVVVRVQLGKGEPESTLVRLWAL